MVCEEGGNKIYRSVFVVYKHSDVESSNNFTSVYTSYGCRDTGIQTEEQEWQQREEQLEKWTLCHISHVSGPIHTKVCVDILINLGYHPVVLKVKV